VDWGEIWPTLEKINPEEWETLRNKLKLTTRGSISYSALLKIGMMKM
jgi:hypothetical protein